MRHSPSIDNRTTERIRLHNTSETQTQSVLLQQNLKLRDTQDFSNDYYGEGEGEGTEFQFHLSECSNETGHFWLSFHMHTGVLWKAWADDQTQFAILL